MIKAAWKPSWFNEDNITFVILFLFTTNTVRSQQYLGLRCSVYVTTMWQLHSFGLVLPSLFDVTMEVIRFFKGFEPDFRKEIIHIFKNFLLTFVCCTVYAAGSIYFVHFIQGRVILVPCRSMLLSEQKNKTKKVLQMPFNQCCNLSVSVFECLPSNKYSSFSLLFHGALEPNPVCKWFYIKWHAQYVTYTPASVQAMAKNLFCRCWNGLRGIFTAFF